METTQKLPPHYHTVMPYLIIDRADEFLNFCREVFEAQEMEMYRRDDQQIMHAEILIGDSTIMFASPTDTYSTSAAGFFIYVSNADRSHQKAIQQGAAIVTPVADQSYGRSGGVKDPFGNTWWITQAPA